MDDHWLKMVGGIATTAIALGVTFFFFWLLSKRKLAKTVGTKPRKKLLSFAINLASETVLGILQRGVEQKGYTIEDSSEIDADLVISDGMTATSMGFYYPIYLTQTDKFATTVEVGIKSKAYQIGPVVKRHHRKCMENLQGLFGQRAA